MHEQCESGHVFWDRLYLKATLSKKLNKLIRHMSEWINSGRAGWGLLSLLVGLAVFPSLPGRGGGVMPVLGFLPAEVWWGRGREVSGSLGV